VVAKIKAEAPLPKFLVQVQVYRCLGCDTYADQEPEPLRCCSHCGDSYFVSDDRACPDCNRPFTRRVHDHGCVDCCNEDGEMVQVAAYACSCSDNYHLLAAEVEACKKEAAMPKKPPKPKPRPEFLGVPGPTKVFIDNHGLTEPPIIYLPDDSRIRFQTENGGVEVRMLRGVLEVRALEGRLGIYPNSGNEAHVRSLPLFEYS